MSVGRLLGYVRFRVLVGLMRGVARLVPLVRRSAAGVVFWCLDHLEQWEVDLI